MSIEQLEISYETSAGIFCEKQRLPLDSNSKEQTFDGIWHLVKNLIATAD